MQKVVGSSPIIRSKKSCKGACRVVCAVNDLLSVASYRVAEQTEITWARDTAAALLGPPGRCWAHVGRVEGAIVLRRPAGSRARRARRWGVSGRNRLRGRDCLIGCERAH